MPNSAAPTRPQGYYRTVFRNRLLEATPQRVLDVGCGRGDLLRFLYDRESGETHFDVFTPEDFRAALPESGLAIEAQRLLRLVPLPDAMVAAMIAESVEKARDRQDAEGRFARLREEHAECGFADDGAVMFCATRTTDGAP